MKKGLVFIILLFMSGCITEKVNIGNHEEFEGFEITSLIEIENSDLVLLEFTWKGELLGVLRFLEISLQDKEGNITNYSFFPKGEISFKGHEQNEKEINSCYIITDIDMKIIDRCELIIHGKCSSEKLNSKNSGIDLPRFTIKRKIDELSIKNIMENEAVEKVFENDLVYFIYIEEDPEICSLRIPSCPSHLEYQTYEDWAWLYKFKFKMEFNRSQPEIINSLNERKVFDHTFRIASILNNKIKLLEVDGNILKVSEYDHIDIFEMGEEKYICEIIGNEPVVYANLFRIENIRIPEESHYKEVTENIIKINGEWFIIKGGESSRYSIKLFNFFEYLEGIENCRYEIEVNEKLVWEKFRKIGEAYVTVTLFVENSELVLRFRLEDEIYEERVALTK